MFRRRTGAYCETNVDLNHGDILVMSRESQDSIDQAIPAERLRTGPRISVIFRLMVSPEEACVQKKNFNAKRETATNNPAKRVVVLTDSRNKNFDCSQFRRNSLFQRNNVPP